MLCQAFLAWDGGCRFLAAHRAVIEIPGRRRYLLENDRRPHRTSLDQVGAGTGTREGCRTGCCVERSLYGTEEVASSRPIAMVVKIPGRRRFLLEKRRRPHSASLNRVGIATGTRANCRAGCFVKRSLCGMAEVASSQRIAKVIEIPGRRRYLLENDRRPHWTSLDQVGISTGTRADCRTGC